MTYLHLFRLGRSVRFGASAAPGRLRLAFAVATLAASAPAGRASPTPAASPHPPRVSTVGHNGMPKNIVPKGAAWNFGPGSLWTHRGWQYAAYWDDACQVSVARRQLPAGAWSVISLPGYQRTANGNRGKGGAISQGFGDGHEKVALGISPDGVIHLSFDHHLSALRYRASRAPVAADPAAHPWRADLFGPVMDHLGGPALASVTYPAFTTDGTAFVLYLRLGGGSGSANSHFFTYAAGKWIVNTEAASQFIDKAWTGGDKTVNAYPHGLVIDHQGRRHLTWCWRDTPVASTSHDLCYAYSDDQGLTWRNNDGHPIGRTGANFITADSPGVSVWPIPSGTKYINGGSMTVAAAGGVHVLVRGEEGTPVLFQRDPASRQWSRRPSSLLGTLVAGRGDRLYVVSADGFARSTTRSGEWEILSAGFPALFKDSTPGIDKTRFAQDGWVSVIGQSGRTVTVVDYWVGE